MNVKSCSILANHLFIMLPSVLTLVNIAKKYIILEILMKVSFFNSYSLSYYIAVVWLVSWLLSLCKIAMTRFFFKEKEIFSRDKILLILGFTNILSVSSIQLALVIVVKIEVVLVLLKEIVELVFELLLVVESIFMIFSTSFVYLLGL